MQVWLRLFRLSPIAQRRKRQKDVDQAAAAAVKVIVYYSDEAGRKVAHFFTKAS